MVDESVGVYFGRSTTSSSLHGLLSAMAKRVHSGACTSSAKQRKTGTDPKWRADFPWMLVIDDGQGMMCSLPQAQPSSP